MQARKAVVASNTAAALQASQRRPSGGAKEALPTLNDLDALFDAQVNADYVARVACINPADLGKLTHLQLKVDLNVQSLLDLADLTPSLSSLVLDESVIGSIRDLGIGLRCLMSLSLNSCSLGDLDGIGVLTGLEDLSCCDNFITDVAPLAMHENMKTLKLSGNNIADISITDALSSCPKLKSLFLARNPIEKAPNYRLIVASLIPSLDKLDGLPVDAAAQKKVSNGMVLEAAFALHMADEELDDERRFEQGLLASAAHEAAASASASAATTYRGTIPDTGSELTHGSAVVLAGNVAAAMRKRRNTAHVSEPASGGTTLEMLDQALLGGMSPAGAGEKANAPYLGEGDVTAAVMGLMHPASQSVALALQTAGGDGAGAVPPPKTEGAYSPVENLGKSSARAAARAGSAAAASASFDLESRDFGDGISGYLAGVSARGSRPKSAVPSSMRGSWVAAEGSSGPPSPRQRNSSRPQSAVTRGSERVAPSAPFKVEVAVVKDRTPNVFHEGNKAKAGNKKGAPRVEEDFDDNTGAKNDDDEDNVFSSFSSSSPSATASASASSSRFGTKSYIHKDLVRRGYDDDDGDIEGIAVTREARQQLMSSSGRRVAEGLNQKPIPSSAATGGSTASARAGISLGFDLKGSLAAIDQWVGELDSDGDSSDDDVPRRRATAVNDDEEEEEVIEAMGTPGDKDKEKDKDGGKKSSRPGSSDVESFGRANPSSRSGSAGSSRTVLSRDAIFSMCSGGALGSIGNGGSNVGCSSTPRSEDDVEQVLFSAASKLAKDADVVTETTRRKEETVFIKKAATSASTKAALPTAVAPVLPNVALIESSASPPRSESDSASAIIARGPANQLSDVELVDMLRRPPKQVPQLRTKSSFSAFFEGMPSSRFRHVLNKAYDAFDGQDSERRAKVDKRLALVKDVLTEG
jgi:hypothetical protein